MGAVPVSSRAPANTLAREAVSSQRVSVSTTDQPDDVARLLEFVKNRDASCPLCGYNLRDLTQPTCPECQQPLALTVGVPQLRFGWFVITIAPGIFSGIAALLMLIPMIGAPLTGGGPPPLGVYKINGFGWLSGIATAVLIFKRYAFLRLPPTAQRLFGIGAWTVHLGVFVVFLGYVFF